MKPDGRHLVSLLLLCLLGALSPALAPASAGSAAPGEKDPVLRALEWREVGPYRGGRSAAVTGVPGEPDLYYFGATGGGVWKTNDGGRSWSNVSDGYFGGSIGAVAVSEWDPNVIYVGGGEKTIRGNVSHGEGVWKSTDAGRSWTHVGLEDTRHIPRIRIHPRRPERVWVAALGHLFGPNEQRGIFRTDDGGKSWERVLFVSEDAGAVDLALDPGNPRILYASFWRVRRTPWSLESGGEGSGLWKSVDGGDSWKEITGNQGLPEGPLGIIGITVSPSNPDNLYAIVEADEGGVFRSKDGGETWSRVNQERKLRQRAWYYSRIYADPVDEETVYVVNVRFHRSRDGGKTFTAIRTPHGDNHDLWIAPEDPRRMIEANDGGANVSYDGGGSWSPQSNQPTAQMYRVSLDNAFPYRLLGGQQDNTALRIRSRSAFGSAIGTRDWEPTAGGESGHVVARPDDPEVVFGGSYGGFLVMLDHRTGERRAVNVWPEDPLGWGVEGMKYRFQWNFPLFFSPHDPNRLYAAGNLLFRSEDGGGSWTAISPDLTRNDPSKMGASGGPITKDNTGVEYYGTIFAAAESPHEAGVLWAGSDDGLVHLSRDGGKTWKNVTPSSFPADLQVNSIDTHPFEKGGLYLAGTRYRLDDLEPYLYRTADWGETWTRIDGGIERDHFTRVVRADPSRPGLLYAGTESGVYLSLDDGKSWRSLQLNLPIVPVTDLAVRNGDLVAATQGRGYWILDDLSPLHQSAGDKEAGSPRLFKPRATHRLRGGRREDPRNQGTNPPDGVIVYYLLPDSPPPESEIRLEILEEDGALIRAFTRKPAPGAHEQKDEGKKLQEDDRLLEAEAGLNRFVWNLRHPGARRFEGMVIWNDSLEGPRAVPGTYRARLTVGEWSSEKLFEVLADPRVSATAADYRAQLDFLLGVRDRLSEAHEAITGLRDLQAQLSALESRLKEREGDAEVIEAAAALREELVAVERALYQTKNESRQDPLNYPIRLNDKLAGLMRLASLGDFPPTASMVAVRDELGQAVAAEIARMDGLVEEKLGAFNLLARERDVEVVLAP